MTLTMNNEKYTQQASAECKVCSTVDRSSRSRHATSGSMAPSSTSTPPTSPDRTPKHQTEAAGISVPTPAATEVEAARLQCGSCCVCDELWVCMVTLACSQAAPEEEKRRKVQAELDKLNKKYGRMSSKDIKKKKKKKKGKKGKKKKSGGKKKDEL